MIRRQDIMAGFTTLLLMSACTPQAPAKPAATCNVEFVILGIGQDAGAPQIGNHNDAAWSDSSLQLRAASGALIDHRTGHRVLFEATPDIRAQLYDLESIAPSRSGPLGLSGVFLTHAHIGHYAGLMFAGHESAGTKNLRVFALPRMKTYLESNGPWDQLVRYENIAITPLENKTAAHLTKDISVTPYLVPHRDEYSETAGFVIQGPSKSILFLPDIDDWDEWETDYETSIESMIAQVDYAYLDATFYDDNELLGRDMSKIPHPRITESMQRFSNLPTTEPQKVRFFHLNHTNKARFKTSPEYSAVIRAGYKVAERGERVCLD